MYAAYRDGMLRRKQTPISIRSDKVAAELRRRARPGVSQARLIEEAFENMPDPALTVSDAVIEERIAKLAALTARIPKGSIMSMKEFDATEYDENGDLRDH